MFKKKRKIALRPPARRISRPQVRSNLQTRRRTRRMPVINKFGKRLLYTTLAILLGYLIFFSNVFLITEITIAEENQDDQALSTQLKTAVKSQIGKNLIFVDTDEIKTKILDTFPELENISVNKNYPNALEIGFTEYALVANVINEAATVKKSYIINSVGYAVKEDLKSTALITIHIESDEPLNTATALIQATKLTYILESITYFEDKFGMKIIKVRYKPNAREVHLLTEREFTIWLDIQRSYEDQFKKLKKALVKLDIYNENLAYIDLRIAGGSGDKIIYRRK